MDLPISLFLLFILFTAGHSLNCYYCSQTESCTQTSQCSNVSTNCFSEIVTVNSSTVKVKGCAPSVCPNGYANFGIGRVSIQCCNTNLCNNQDAPDPSNTPNGNKCYYCDGNTCSNTVNCSGTEDRCFNTTAMANGVHGVFKGCVSKSLCDAPQLVPDVKSVSCCSGNLCNGAQSVSVTQSVTHSTNSAQSVSQSFLFLCCSLLSFILLH